MILELTTDNMIQLFALGATGVSAVLGVGIRIVSNQNTALKKELDEVKECLQDTRLNYVTNEKFDRVMEKMDSKLDKVIELLASKPDKGFCDVMHSRINKLDK